MMSLKRLGAAFCATSMLSTINVANAKIFVGTSQVVESINLIDKDLIESQNNELIAFKKDKEVREMEKEIEEMRWRKMIIERRIIEMQIEMKGERDKKRKREIEKEIMEEERELEREIKEMAIRKREIQREMERRIMERRIMERKRFIGITEKSLPYSVDCPPKNKDLKIKQNKKEKFVVRFASGKRFYRGLDFDEALEVFGETYEDKCVE